METSSCWKGANGAFSPTSDSLQALTCDLCVVLVAGRQMDLGRDILSGTVPFQTCMDFPAVLSYEVITPVAPGNQWECDS